jgi:hypothetical protein
LRKLIIKAFGDIREYPLDTPIEIIMGLNRTAKDFAIIEYKGA